MLNPKDLLAERVLKASPSATVAVSELARQLTSQGRTIISLSEGELDFDTPAHIQQAAIKGIVNGMTRYTNVGGMPQLKAAIVHKFSANNHLHYKGEEIIAGTGAKQILFNAFLATLNAGDEVIVVAPYWVSYSEMVKIADGVAVQITPPADNDFKLTPELLEAAITDKTKWLVLNAPCNPSGALYTAEEFEALAVVLRKHPKVMVLSDDIYEEIVYEGKFVSFAEAAPDMKERTLTINGVSKAYAMTGWRLGYAGGPSWLIKAMQLLQSHSTSNPSSVSQVAATEALSGSQHLLVEWRQRLKARRDMALSILSNVSDILKIRKPAAAFYLYANCEAAIGMVTPQGTTIETDTDFARYILEEAGVAIVPGTAFGLAPYVRLAYALSDEKLKQACEQIVAACQRLKKA